MRALPRQVEYPTLAKALVYLEASNKILLAEDGSIDWVFVDNPRLLRLLAESPVIKSVGTRNSRNTSSNSELATHRYPVSIASVRNECAKEAEREGRIVVASSPSFMTCLLLFRATGGAICLVSVESISAAATQSLGCVGEVLRFRLRSLSEESLHFCSG